MSVHKGGSLWYFHIYESSYFSYIYPPSSSFPCLPLLLTQKRELSLKFTLPRSRVGTLVKCDGASRWSLEFPHFTFMCRNHAVPGSSYCPSEAPKKQECYGLNVKCSDTQASVLELSLQLRWHCLGSTGAFAPYSLASRNGQQCTLKVISTCSSSLSSLFWAAKM